MFEKRKPLGAFLLLFGILILALDGKLHAKEPGTVQEVKDEAMMYSQLVQSMRRREKEVCFSYPGLYTDISRYQEDYYEEFFERLAEEDCYTAGCIESIRIRYFRREDTSVMFLIQYRTTARMERYVNHKVRNITKKVKKRSDAYKAKWARDYLVQHMQYDQRYHTAYDAFRQGRGNCMAYAYAYVRLLQELDVPCIYVSGNDHAWNMVELDGKWYSVDVTWDDVQGDYSYFLKGEKDFKGHEILRYGFIKKRRMAKRAYIFR